MKAKAASNMAFIFVLVYVPYQVGIFGYEQHRHSC